MTQKQTPPYAHVTAEAARTLRNLAGDAAEREVCGVLFGVQRPRGLVVTEVRATPNEASAGDAFLIAPTHIVACLRASKEQPLGFWHTHRSGALSLSDEDRRGHERFVRIVPQRMRRERALVVVDTSDPRRIALHWFTGDDWVRVPVRIVQSPSEVAQFDVSGPDVSGPDVLAP